MSHKEQLAFIKICIEVIKESFDFKKLNCLEVGSYDFNGEVRNLFKVNNYTGVDTFNGPGVDIVMNGKDVEKIGKKFDITISCECFEHTQNWNLIFQSLYNVLNNDGVMLITCASRGRNEHGTTRSGADQSPGTINNYYKNLNESDFKKKFKIKDMFSSYAFYYNIHSYDLYFIGHKKGGGKKLDINKIRKQIKIENNFKPPFNNSKRFLLSFLIPDKLRQDIRFFLKKFKKGSQNT